jgi:hypothetical protein
MAREAGLHRQQHNLMSSPVQIRYSYDGYEEQLKAFEALVRADEREVCAKVCDELRGVNWGPEQCATAIRARGNT